MRRKTKLYASGLLVVFIALVVGYFVLWRDTSVTVYNDNFKIIDYSMSVGSIHAFYNGNQAIGRFKARLKSLFGLKSIKLSRLVITGEEGFVLLMNYTGDLSFEELDGLTAVLRNDNDFFKQMQGTNKYDRDRQIFTGCFTLPKVPESDDSLRIDFYLSSEYDEPVASLKVGDLSKYNKKPNAAL